MVTLQSAGSGGDAGVTMETSLRFDSGKKHLKLFAKEKFSNDDNYVLTVRRRDSS